MTRLLHHRIHKLLPVLDNSSDFEIRIDKISNCTRDYKLAIAVSIRSYLFYVIYTATRKRVGALSTCKCI